MTHERVAVKVQLNQASNIRSNYFASNDFSFKLFFCICEMNLLPPVVAAEVMWCVEFVNILSHFKRFLPHEYIFVHYRSDLFYFK